MSRNNPEYDARMRAEGWWKALDIAKITGISESSIRRAATGWRARKVDPAGASGRGWVWIYYHIDSVLLWLGPDVAPKLAPRFGVGVDRAQALTAPLKGQHEKRGRGRPPGVERLRPKPEQPPSAPGEFRPVGDVIVEPNKRRVRRVVRSTGREDPANATSPSQD